MDAITGQIASEHISNADASGGRTIISWQTNDPQGGELRVRTARNETKVVARGRQGRTELSWLTGTHPYRFELYSKTNPAQRLDRIEVEPTESSVEQELRQLSLASKTTAIDEDQLARFIARAIPRLLQSRRYSSFFELWQEAGFHVTPVHFYQPIPDTRELLRVPWYCLDDLAGIDMNAETQLHLLRNCFPVFREEYEKIPITSDDPTQFSLTNSRFDCTDALMAYCMIRHFKPRRVVEIGSGHSTILAAQACMANGHSELSCIEPFPADFLLDFPNLHALLQKRVQEVELDFFSQLGAGDILFIDSSHTVKMAGDVNYLFLQVLPRLNPGVIVHVHDIFFPFDYPRPWVTENVRFWTEQYLLQAFLEFNSQFEVLLCNSYLTYFYLSEMQAIFPTSPRWGGGSFWLRRRLNGHNVSGA